MRFTILVKEVMKTQVKTAAKKDSIESAAKTMKNNRIGSVVVMDEDSAIGILTLKDIVYKHVAEGHGRTVGDIMTYELVTISPNKTIENAARLMKQKRIERLPVFENGKIIGIISNNDILEVEPALFDILLEKMKIGGVTADNRSNFGECESCGNYSDDLAEESGVYTCAECREK